MDCLRTQYVRTCVMEASKDRRLFEVVKKSSCGSMGKNRPPPGVMEGVETSMDHGARPCHHPDGPRFALPAHGSFGTLPADGTARGRAQDTYCGLRTTPRQYQPCRL